MAHILPSSSVALPPFCFSRGAEALRGPLLRWSRYSVSERWRCSSAFNHTWWPENWPVWAQIFVAGAIIDFGLYAMHRLSHIVDWLWRLHAPHHSAQRLYWLNGERRHPLSALCLAAPGIFAVVALGAPPLVVSAWRTLLSVHRALQHANLDYAVGPMRKLLGVAEIHRWHHKREYEDAQVNFGELDGLGPPVRDFSRPVERRGGWASGPS